MFGKLSKNCLMPTIILIFNLFRKEQSSPVIPIYYAQKSQIV